MDAAVWAALAAGVAAVASAGLTYWATRRTTRGRVGTSEAAVLWDQAQAMRTELVSQRDRAEAQRDRLIESQATQVLPALEAINEGLRQITAAVGRLLARAESGPGSGGP